MRNYHQAMRKKIKQCAIIIKSYHNQDRQLIGNFGHCHARRQLCAIQLVQVQYPYFATGSYM